MKPILALSTSWCSHRHQDGYAMAEEMAGLGFSTIELSHGIRVPLVPGILRAVKAGVVRIASTHNFCPLPVGVSQPAPNLYEPSALHAREHEQWIRQTKRSIEFAAQVNAGVLVCHLGRVRFPFNWLNPARKLDVYRERPGGTAAGVTADPAYVALAARAIERIRRRAPAYSARMRASIDAVLDHARQHGVTLGFENRERCDELPLDDEWADFLGRFPADAPIGYWHDTGHAALKQAMGLLQPEAHLQRMQRWTLGFHLHDVTASGRDHQPIGRGRVDFAAISRHWRPSDRLTLELSPRASVADVTSSRAAITALLDARAPAS